MKNKLIVLLMIVGVGALSIYLVIPYEVQVNFKTNTLPGDVIETIRLWNRSLDSAKITEVDSLARVRQELAINGSSYNFDWNFVLEDDSITAVKIKISEPNSRLKNKFLVPLTNSKLESDVGPVANTFYSILSEHLKITKVQVVGKAIIDSSFCICHSLETQQIAKANGMMHDYPLLTSFISEHRLKATGQPILRINEWRHSSNLIKFDFCFPIQYRDSLPIVQDLFYKKFKREKGLMAIYNGNYITSDRAWYQLLKYAEINNIQVKPTPIEQFLNNPNLGMNERHWRANIFLPIID